MDIENAKLEEKSVILPTPQSLPLIPSLPIAAALSREDGMRNLLRRGENCSAFQSLRCIQGVTETGKVIEALLGQLKLDTKAPRMLTEVLEMLLRHRVFVGYVHDFFEGNLKGFFKKFLTFAGDKVVKKVVRHFFRFVGNSDAVLKEVKETVATTHTLMDKIWESIPKDRQNVLKEVYDFQAKAAAAEAQLSKWEAKGKQRTADYLKKKEEAAYLRNEEFEKMQELEGMERKNRLLVDTDKVMEIVLHLLALAEYLNMAVRTLVRARKGQLKEKMSTIKKIMKVDKIRRKMDDILLGFLADNIGPFKEQLAVFGLEVKLLSELTGLLQEWKEAK